MSLTDVGGAPVPSPCIDVCELDDSGLCLGCFRSSDEIMAWPALNSDGKRRILNTIEQRRLRSDAGSAGD
jgi:hypothetical protein